ncbi:MAG: dephospho-CoA kinase [Desulfovibrio sp.]|nr:MAG: dephospho-CoA kinase [Desulfovibrio sp.]
MDPHQRHFTLILSKELDQTRLDHVVGLALADLELSRERHKTLIREGCVLVDGEVKTKPAFKAAAGQTVAIELPDVPLDGPALAPVPGPLDILRQDPDLVVLNKPAGLTVHPAPGITEPTLVHHLLHEFPELAGPAMDPERPGIVHRLDKDTSGLLLVALNEPTRLKLSRAFADRSIHKEYLAVVHGVPDPSEGRFDQAIGRHPASKVKMAVVPKGGREALSEYEVLYADPKGRFSLVRVILHTGRTHQIRVHFQHAGHPLVGDQVYGDPVAMRQFPGLAALAARQMLHAWKLTFSHPTQPESPDWSLRQAPPKDMGRAMCFMSRSLQRVVITGLPGCGKSSLLRELAAQGVPCFSADQAVAELYEPGADGWSFVRNRYGDRFLLGDDDEERIDKQALFAAMRESSAIKGEIEGALHPMVWHQLDTFWANNSHKRMAVAEIPLFLESKLPAKGRADMLVAVYCPRELRFDRLAASRGWDQDMLAAMESWQWPEAKKMQACDLVVDNSGALELIPGRASALIRVLRCLRRDKSRGLHARWFELFTQA